jgi:hypothetical protein
MFYIIGLGLSDEKDITLRGLEVKMPRLARFGASLDIYFASGGQVIYSPLPRGVHEHSHRSKGALGISHLRLVRLFDLTLTPKGGVLWQAPYPCRSRHGRDRE